MQTGRRGRIAPASPLPGSFLLASFLLAALLLLVAACSKQPDNTETARADVPKHGGQATVLLGSDFAGSWPAGLDPATNVTGGSNLSLMNAIYGGLFQLTADADGGNPTVKGVLATGYEIVEEGRAVIIHLRKGVTFSDGSPFNAAAVKFNIDRNLASPCSCSPTAWPWADKDRVTTPDEHTVVLHFSRPYGPVVNSFPVATINWIASPTALEKLGADRFKITPVGAGPFRVVSNQLSSKLVLERNPLYWQKDRPYLDRLVFQSIGSEQAAYQALLAGDAQAFEGMTSTLLIKQAEADSRVRVTRQPPTSPFVVQLNTAVAPFNDARARQAIYYATDSESIRTGLFHGWYPVSQTFTAPGGRFHHEKIPGYRTYDPEKARSLVNEVGGLRVTLGTLHTAVGEQLVTALQSQWKRAGIDVAIEAHDLGTLIKRFESRQWQAMLQTAGSYDPEAGTGIRFRFRAGATFSGLHDQELDRLMAAATGTVDAQARDELYLQISRYISDNAYAPFLLATSPAQLTRGLHGPGLTTPIPPIVVNTAILWQDVWSAE